MNLRNYSSLSVTWRFWVTREELELLTDIHDFTTLFLEMQVLQMVGVLYQKGLESDLGM